MPDFDKSRGVAAMEGERKAGGKGGGSQYWNYIRWREDKETKHVLFLTPAAELITVMLHEWIETGKTKNGKPRYAFFIDRRDPCIGEEYDDLADRLDTPSKRRTLGVAVELEPTTTKINNRNKVTGFEVKLESFTRTDENGDETEVRAPLIGIVSQAKGNFYGWLGSFAESHDPIEETPFEITRSGKGTDTTYVIVPFNNIPVDYSNLFEYINNVGALLPIVREQLKSNAAEGEDQLAQAMMIGATFLDAYLDEIADGERYQELVGPIEYIEDKFGNRASRNGNSNPPQARYHEPTADELILAPEAVEEDKIERLKRQFAKK